MIHQHATDASIMLNAFDYLKFRQKQTSFTSVSSMVNFSFAFRDISNYLTRAWA